MKTEYSLLIDWLTISGKWTDWEEMFEFLGLQHSDILTDFEECNGQDFYKYGLVYRSENKRAISFNMCNANAPENCEIRLSGKGCRVFETYSELTFDELIARIVTTEGVNCSRLDIAYDIKDCNYPMQRFISSYKKNLFVTKSRKSRIVYNKDGYDYDGSSIYFGKRDSLMEVNIYDKASERGYTSIDLPEGWVRIELRLRRAAALSFLNEYVNTDRTIGELYFSVLRNQVRFVRPNKSDSNRRRWKNAKWWDELTQNAEIVKLSMPGIVYDIPKYQENVVRRVSSSLQTWFKLNPDATLDDFLKESDRLHIEMNKVQKYIVKLNEMGIEWLDPNIDDL